MGPPPHRAIRVGYGRCAVHRQGFIGPLGSDTPTPGQRSLSLHVPASRRSHWHATCTSRPSRLTGGCPDDVGDAGDVVCDRSRVGLRALGPTFHSQLRVTVLSDQVAKFDCVGTSRAHTAQGFEVCSCGRMRAPATAPASHRCWSRERSTALDHLPGSGSARARELLRDEARIAPHMPLRRFLIFELSLFARSL